MAGYEASKFGTGIDVGSTNGNVTTSLGAPHNFFGPRASGGSSGSLDIEGAIEQYVFELAGDEINDVLGPLTPQYLPKGSIIRDAYLYVSTAFALTGTSPTILVGTKSSEVTNGLVISKTVAEAGGASTRLTATLTGTWAQNTPLAARTQIGFAIGGTSTPTVDRLGRARLTLEVIRPANIVND